MPIFIAPYTQEFQSHEARGEVNKEKKRIKLKEIHDEILEETGLHVEEVRDSGRGGSTDGKKLLLFEIRKRGFLVLDENEINSFLNVIGRKEKILGFEHRNRIRIIGNFN